LSYGTLVRFLAFLARSVWYFLSIVRFGGSSYHVVLRGQRASELLLSCFIGQAKLFLAGRQPALPLKKFLLFEVPGRKKLFIEEPLCGRKVLPN